MDTELGRRRKRWRVRLASNRPKTAEIATVTGAAKTAKIATVPKSPPWRGAAKSAKIATVARGGQIGRFRHRDEGRLKRPK